MDLTAALEALPIADRPRVDREAGVLVGSRCSACGSHAWPSRAVCHRCGCGDVTIARLSVHGTLVSYTVCWVPRPGLEVPFTIGQVHLPEGVTVFSHVSGLPDGSTVPRPVIIRLADDAADEPIFWFDASGGARGE